MTIQWIRSKNRHKTQVYHCAIRPFWRILLLIELTPHPELLPSATDEEWYSPKRPYSTMVNLSFMTIFTTNY